MAEILTYPHEVFRSRQQDIRAYDNQHPGLSSVVKKLYKTEGFKGFYTGFGITLTRSIPHTAIMFVIYEYLRANLKL